MPDLPQERASHIHQRNWTQKARKKNLFVIFGGRATSKGLPIDEGDQGSE